MKQKTFFLACVFAAVLVAGCDHQDSTSKQIDKVQADAADAMKEMKDYTYAQKAEFTAAMKQKLATMDRELNALEAKVAKSSEDVKAQAQPKLQALREQQAALGKQLDKLNAATESTWESVKDGASKAYDSFKDGFQKSRQWLSDKIKP
jgi:DNA anti-recombination protein RmuC